jgi:DUF1680 family protein
VAAPTINRRQMLSRAAALGAAALSPPSPRPLAAPTHSEDPPAALRAHPFELRDVRLLDGPFKDAMQRDRAYLLKLDFDCFLSYFRETAGLKPNAPAYGGWEAKVGRMLGHYLSACSMMYASTGDGQFLERGNYIVNQLEECQHANGNGYVGGIPDGKRLFAELAKGKVELGDSSLNGVHAPWYMMHKEFAGLRDAYLLCGSTKAKRVLTRLADWACSVGAGMDDEQFQRMLECEYGGMSEVLADASAITGDSKYLKLAERFNHRAVLDSLMSREDRLDGLHANTQIPKLIGLARQYELTGDQRLLTGATFFWEQVTQKRSYAIGGNSDDEHFFPIGEMDRHLHAASAETCNTYNMLKLTRHLFCLEPKAAYADYYERALYNHILASQDPETGMMLYFFSLQPGHFKTFSTPFDSFWCCVGTGMENHAKYGGSIYFHNGKNLYVNLYIASDLDWKERGVRIRQETKFPEEETTRLTVTAQRDTEMALRIRHPYWATAGIEVAVNGKPFAGASEPGSYFAVERTWRNGDVLEIHLPMTLRVEPMPDNQNRFTIMYGPVVLGGALGTEGYHPPIPFAGNNELKFAKVPDPPTPGLATSDRPVNQWVHPVVGKTLTFKASKVAGPEVVILQTLNALDRQRYTVYWDKRPAVLSQRSTPTLAARECGDGRRNG